MTINNLLETTRCDESALEGDPGALPASAEWLCPHSWTSGFPSVKWEVGEHSPLKAPAISGNWEVNKQNKTKAHD